MAIHFIAQGHIIGPLMLLTFINDGVNFRVELFCLDRIVLINKMDQFYIKRFTLKGQKTK